MRCEIILVNWKRPVDTCDCIASLEHTTGIEWHIVVCENGSPDDSAIELRNFLGKRYSEKRRLQDNPAVYDYFAESFELPRVTLVLSRTNLGFAGGNNLGYQYRHDNSDFFWFLNNDTTVESTTLIQMVDRMKQDTTIGICGPTIVYMYDKKTIQAFSGARYFPSTGFISEIGNGKTWPCAVDINEVEARLRYVSGASMLVSADFIKRVGLMCEDYFLYYEEIDWAERGRKAGFRLGYAPQAVVYHREGAALGSGKSQKRSALSEYYGLRGRLTITRRFFPWALPTVFLFSLLQIFRRCTQGYWGRARLMCAVLFGLRRIPPEA